MTPRVGQQLRREFQLNLGNGAVRLSVDGERLEIPDAAEPLGYRIAVDGVEELEEGSRPTCAE